MTAPVSRRPEKTWPTLLIAVLAAGLGTTACGPGEGDDDDTFEVQTCSDKTHEKVGMIAELETKFHGVEGTVEVLDDCNLEIRDFSYDGGGLRVAVVGATGPDKSDFAEGDELSENIFGDEYKSETLAVPLPVGVSLDDFTHISIWCSEAAEDFGSGELVEADTDDE